MILDLLSVLVVVMIVVPSYAFNFQPSVVSHNNAISRSTNLENRQYVSSSYTTYKRKHYMSSSSDSDEIEQLQQTVTKLRAEAQAAEEILQSSRGKQDEEYIKPIEYTDLKDSCWEITYRFANEPINDDDDNDKDKDKIPRQNYGGKLQLQFKSDGYTDILVGTETTSTTPNTARFKKVWGWDIEKSQDDSLEYLLFSADIGLQSNEERFYFQARVDREGKNKDIIALNDGSVTVKRNVKSPLGGGGWGLFKGAGSILAVFRIVGEFKCKPIQNPNTD